jgi:chromosome segregation protein
LTEALGAIAGQESALAGEQSSAERELETALAAREKATADEHATTAALPALEQAVAAKSGALAELVSQIASTEQDVRVAETRRDSSAHMLMQLAARQQRLQQELAGIRVPTTDPLREVEEQLAQENRDLAGKHKSLSALQQAVASLQERQRETAETWQRDSTRAAELEARSQALSALQAKIGHGQDIDAWLDTHGLGSARRLWQSLDIERGWENALEAVLRERLNAIELSRLDDAAAWVDRGAQPPQRIAAYVAASAPAAARDAPHRDNDSLLAKVKRSQPETDRLLADGLHGVRCRPDLESALADRTELGEGGAFVTPEGHLVSAQGVTFFAPEGELHGVLARQRELDELAALIVTAAAAAVAAREARDAVDHELQTKQQAWHAEGQAVASQQRRVHDLELELVALQQAAEAAERRRAQIAQETADVAAQEAQERKQREVLIAEIANLQSRLHEEIASRETAHHARNEAEVELARGRERVRAAEHASQEAGFAERSCRDRLAELERRRESLTAQGQQQKALLAQFTTEQAAIDWTPVEEALQQQLAVRGAAEQALAAARDHQESLTAQLRAGDEARLTAEQRLEPARVKIQDMQLKEQAAALAEQQFAEQLTEAQAELASLPEALKAWGSARTLPAEIERLGTAIAELGAVNLAALDELTQTSERKDYLDRQAADLTEAMATLESAIRQIDRESRELLQQTFAAVNANFARLFPTLFGGGQARLVLTGEEILDSGVQVIAQPPGKRNTSIHLLSGGEKALTAIALVFALFQLNPAPFCLLDEVDAPLDDPNTDRFCAMVREMASDTQFLFISHNKITMEMAHQLVGITMPEPGVSRVVAVDIAEALTLAENAA